MATREIETETYNIKYNTTDESFDHAFGTDHVYGYEIASVSYFISEVDAFVELGKDLGKFEKYVNAVIADDIEEKGYL